MSLQPIPLLLASSGAHQIYEPNAGWVTFFVLLLLAIAILPLVKEHWWEKNTNKAIIAGLLSIPVLILYLFESPGSLIHSMSEYFSFIVLLWSLYTVSGGIVLRGSFQATPEVNTAFMAAGAVLANVFGTTGAAMLLIRPLLRSNEFRKNKKHIIIFFIFIVANMGGSLTPLGDPPLFLGYLRGVPFTWTLSLFPIWLPTILAVILFFYIWDRKAWASETPDVRNRRPTNVEKVALAGSLNFIFIAGILCATIFSGDLLHLSKITGFGWGEGSPWREIIMISMGILSMIATQKALRSENGFNFAAITEVAVLFAGIFITMIPALALLELHGKELGLTQPWQYLWTTGTLSSFLDNAPTYLVFATAAVGYVDGVETIGQLAHHAQGDVFLKAISIGAVFMGANTYIGNAPNFMVKVIAETAGERRVRMPSFFGYMAYSVLILLPLFAIMTVVAFVMMRGYL